MILLIHRLIRALVWTIYYFFKKTQIFNKINLDLQRSAEQHIYSYYKYEYRNKKEVGGGSRNPTFLSEEIAFWGFSAFQSSKFSAYIRFSKFKKAKFSHWIKIQSSSIWEVSQKHYLVFAQKDFWSWRKAKKFILKVSFKMGFHFCRTC